VRRLAVICATSLMAAGAYGSLSGDWAAGSVDVGIQYTAEQRRAVREIGWALHAAKNMYENPPVCLRLKPDGSMIAVVLGARNRPRIARVLAELHIHAALTVTSIAAYNAGLRQLAGAVSASKPPSFAHVRVGYLQIPTLKDSPDLDFEPQCPDVTVTKPSLKAEGSYAAEDAWVDEAEQRYGSDRVMWWCCTIHSGQAKALAATTASSDGAVGQ
jgi:hypothetical protein